MFNKMSSPAMLCKKNKKQIKENKKSQELLKNKEKFMNLKGYRIKVGEDTFILFEKEEIYLVLFCIEKVFFDFHNDLFNEKEGIRLFFRLSVLQKYLKSFGEIKINVYYDESKYETPLKVKFPNYSCCDDYERGEEIEDKIEILEENNKLQNINLMETYDNIKQNLRKIISVSYIKKIAMI